MFDARKIIGPRLRSCRLANGWTFQETADLLSEISGKGCIPSKYGNWEMMINTPPLEWLFYLGKLFKRPAAWLAGLSDDDGSELGGLNLSYRTPVDRLLPTGQGVLSLGSNALAFHTSFIANLKIQPENLLVTEAPDDSMAGVIEKGDLVVVDMGDKALSSDDLFALLVNGRLWLRWIRQQINTSYLVQAEIRERYTDQIVPPGEQPTFDIIGRVRLITHVR